MPKPNGQCFDKAWKNRSRVRLSNINECARFFNSHYLHRRPAVVPLVLVIEVDGIPSGMVCFALPPKEVSVRYCVYCWELARLWLDDRMPTNAETWAIGQAVRYVKRQHPDVKLLISYADPSVGHEGGIYRAANWIADGVTENGRRTPRFDYILRENGLFDDIIKRYSRSAHAPTEKTVLERLPRASKKRFIYWL